MRWRVGLHPSTCPAPWRSSVPPLARWQGSGAAPCLGSRPRTGQRSPDTPPCWAAPAGRWRAKAPAALAGLRAGLTHAWSIGYASQRRSRLRVTAALVRRRAGVPLRLCGAARHCFLSPHGLSNALEWTLCLASPIAPQGAKGRHRLRCAPPVPEPGTQPGPAGRKCSGSAGSFCQGCPRYARRFAALTAPTKPLLCGRRLAGKTGWGRDHSGHRWCSRWSQRSGLGTRSRGGLAEGCSRPGGVTPARAAGAPQGAQPPQRPQRAPAPGAAVGARPHLSCRPPRPRGLVRPK